MIRLRCHVALTLFLFLAANRQCQGKGTITYKPVKGYYVCPKAGQTCTIQNCNLEGGTCDQFINDFARNPYAENGWIPISRSIRDNEVVYTSMGEQASIALGSGDADAIICDAECECHHLFYENDGSCQVATVVPSFEPSIIPSIEPSFSPSSGPSTSPSISPSAKPSISPSLTPSTSKPPSTRPPISPSLSPSIAPFTFPSRSPTLFPTISSSIPSLLHYISGDVVFDTSTPQYKAARWLVRNDNHDYDAAVQRVKLYQRYALVALDFAFHQNDESKLDWTDPNTDECFWDGVTCATFDGIPRIRTINWARRKLKGKALPEFKLLPALNNLDLAQNKIEGTLDPFYSLHYLNNLYLFENRISGTLDGIGNLTRIERLYLGKNQLSGTIPIGLWQEHRDRPLQWLILHHNKLTGTLPMGMRLGHLRYLDLSHNSFVGTIPTDWPTKLLTMRSLYLDHNQLTGEIPEDFARIGLGWLKQLYLNDNRLTGRFPEGWNPIWYLTNIDIRNNRFTRDMPSSVCAMNVFQGAEMVELRADCDICDCGKPLCDNCNDRR